MSGLFEMLFYEAVNCKTDVPVLLLVNGAAIIQGEVDGNQQCAPFSPPRHIRLLNASLIDVQRVSDDASLWLPRPPMTTAISLPGGPNRRWLVTSGATIISGEEVSWDQWLDYNSSTNGGGWHPELVTALKQQYPLNIDERAYFHLINVRIHSAQAPATLGGPIYVPATEIRCFGNRW
ncbi:hypothetical protein BH23CHL2_BH23CHL2_18630 [soil metagenome]